MQEWVADNTPRHAAALAYYTVFALSPLFTIVFSIAGALYGYEIAQANMVALVEYYIPNPGVADMLHTVLSNSIETSSNPLLTLFSICVLIYGATSVFSELQSALNLIWDAPTKTVNGLWEVVHNRLFAVLMVFLGGLALFVALLVATLIAAANQWAEIHLRVIIYSEWVVFFSLFGISAVIFALIYKFVPDVEVAWRDVLVGAVATALLFTVARTLIIWSLRYNSLTSIFGATGSLVVFLVWIYYSALIFFLGAEFTQVYGRTYGSHWRDLPILMGAPSTQEPTTATTDVVVIVEDKPTDMVKAGDQALGARPIASESQPEKPEAMLGESQPNHEEPSMVSPPTQQGRLQAVREQLRRGMNKLQQGAQALRKVPGSITSPIGDIAIGVAVVGALSVAGLLWEPWRRKQREKKS
jgi:membrane protein